MAIDSIKNFNLINPLNPESVLLPKERELKLFKETNDWNLILDFKYRPMMTDIRKAAANSTFAIGGVSFSADGFVVTESSVLRMNFCAEKPRFRKAVNHYGQD